MKNKRSFIYSKGWIVLVATTIGLGFGGYTFVHRAVTSHVYVTNCGMQDYKPSSIIKFCADAGVTIEGIEWDTWGKDGAEGKGIYRINDCIPTCVAGKFHDANVIVTLSKIKAINGKPTLTFVSIMTNDKKNLPLSDSPIDAWPMELAG